MKNEDVSSSALTQTSTEETKPSDSRNAMKRRSFLKGIGMTGVALSAGALFADEGATEAEARILLRVSRRATLPSCDSWLRPSCLKPICGSNMPNSAASPRKQNAYQKALQRLDGDGSQYITSNTLDELSHAEFLNAYLLSKGAEPVDLDAFRTLPSSQASGAQQIGRLTTLANLTVDTSWFTRYRSSDNPDLGGTFPQAIDLVNVPAIPLTDADFASKDHIQAIANTAAFHFAMIEQGGSTLYSAMAQKASNLEVLRIVVSIGGDEVAHFLEWVDFAGNGVQGPVAPFTDPTNGLTFPDFNATGNPLLQTNLIFPVPWNSSARICRGAR